MEGNEILRYPVGIQSFEKLREMGYLYVDKTAVIGKLITRPGYYFLSRPRRFGKSLLLSTLKAYFEGKRDLFAGLAIDRDDIPWTKRPVFMLMLNSMAAESEKDLDSVMEKFLADYESEYGLPSGNPSGLEYPQRLIRLFEHAHKATGKRIVLLVDEYDAPLLSTLDKPELNRKYKAVLRAVFNVMKEADSIIEFAMLTGVSRFSQTSLFSGPNNLNDITMQPDFAAICGITDEEIHRDLTPAIAEFANANNISKEDAFSRLKENYDGYHFTKNSPDIYNPFSVISALNNKNIGNYWFRSGTPTFLVKALMRDGFYLPDLDEIEADAMSLSDIESYAQNPVALLFETGYLTIKHFDPEYDLYHLGLPNKEVSDSFLKFLLPHYTRISPRDSDSELKRMKGLIKTGDAEGFMEYLKSFMAEIPYSNIDFKVKEKYFKNNLYLILKLLGFNVRTELETSFSRMDMALETDRFAYIFELKMDSSAESALKQIKDRGYDVPFSCKGKKIIQIGASYSSRTNNIDSWVIGAPEGE